MGWILIAVALILLYGDPSVQDERGAVRKTGAVLKGVGQIVTDHHPQAPSPFEDFWGWLTWDDEK